MAAISIRMILIVAEPGNVTSSQEKRSLIAFLLAVLLPVCAGAALAVGAIADSTAVLSLVPFRTYAAILFCGGAIGSIGILLKNNSGSAYLRAVAFTLAVGCSLIWTAQAAPTVDQVLNQIRPASTPSVRPAQSSSLIAEGGSLEHADYFQENLSHSRLSHTRVVDVDFGNANLSESDFRGAVFVRVNFAGANLCAVDLRGADLSQADNLNEVKNWNFVYYDATTKLPPNLDFNFIQGPQEAAPGGLLYSCTPNQTRQLLDDGSRK